MSYPRGTLPVVGAVVAPPLAAGPRCPATGRKMETFRFLHAADLHLDTPFEGISACRPEVGEALRDASLDAFDRLVAAALDRRVAFVVLAGDVYDGPERGLRAQLRFRRGVERLAAAGIEVLVAHGNHDPVESGWTAIRSWPPGVHVFAPGRVETVSISRDGRRLAAVHGVSYSRRGETENLALRFRGDGGPGLQVGVLHGNVGGRPGHDPYAPCTLGDLRAAGIDYWALGHVHSREALLRGPVWAVYPGNLQGRSPRSGERGEKGAVLVEADPRAVRSVLFLPLAPVTFEAVEVDAAGAADLGEVEDRIVAAAREVGRGPGRKGTVLEVVLRGATELHGVLREEAAALQAALADRLPAESPWIWVERIEVRTSPPVDRRRALARDDLAGAVLRRLEALRSDPGALAALVAEVDRDLLRSPAARWIARGARATGSEEAGLSGAAAGAEPGLRAGGGADREAAPAPALAPAVGALLSAAETFVLERWGSDP
jgi:exonuclease SbcD